MGLSFHHAGLLQQADYYRCPRASYGPIGRRRRQGSSRWPQSSRCKMRADGNQWYFLQEQAEVLAFPEEKITSPPHVVPSITVLPQRSSRDLSVECCHTRPSV